VILNSSDIKGQMKPKADWRTIDSPKKQMNKFVVAFAMTVRKYLKLEILISSFKNFLTVKPKKKNVRSVLSELYKQKKRSGKLLSEYKLFE
jgi:hypothetical protein